MQEVHADKETVKKLAERLDWDHYQGTGKYQGNGDCAIMSRYPIIDCHSGTTEMESFVCATINLGGREIIVYSAHLEWQAYAPYKADVGKRIFTSEVRAEECGPTGKNRGEQIEEILKVAKEQLEGADSKPVIIAGDFNCPSHQDWVPGVGEEPTNWPATTKLVNSGMCDSYRMAHPYPKAHPGETWSPITPWNEHINRVEPQDRIDFIFYKGNPLTVLDSYAYVTGNYHTEYDNPNHGGDHAQYYYNDWPSDHAAVITTFRVN
jgi:endonuclease/exonuclease/phosphatase family metal-dependent hydrolase